jgi:hypothetical protein
MFREFAKVMNERGASLSVNPYPNFAYCICKKVRGLKLQEETRIISECRALLTSYDDFMFGLKMNQELYNQLKDRFGARMAALQESYDEKVKRLLVVAESKGILPDEFEPLALKPANP